MLFRVLTGSSAIKRVAQKPAIFLAEDNWDDWFEFSTLYNCWYRDEFGESHHIGGVKIGQFGMAAGQRRPTIPSKFSEIPKDCFSIGQDESYYEELSRLAILTDVLAGLNDIAANLELFEIAKIERVTGLSLLRSISSSTVRGQFHRLAHGGLRLSKFNFSYIAPSAPDETVPVKLSFQVTPESNPPTNVHVLIGRNGVGKTTILNNMTQALMGGEPESHGYFEPRNAAFANVVSVTFSAFDPFEPLPIARDHTDVIQYFYIGLKRRRKPEDLKKNLPNKSHSALAKEFSESLNICRHGARLKRWRKALQMLESDGIFKEAEIAKLAEETIDDFLADSPEESIKQRALSVFSRLSSGHKIVLLTITRLVETVEEKTLVLIDEPEAHLHPPLLSAFVRALSDLLVDRNGVAVIATHSPVILQEVPQKCVWKIRRNNRIVKAERPLLETFGENVGILTHEVFGLEVTRSGFHELIKLAVSEEYSIEEVLDRFGGELGGEARAIAQALFTIKSRKNNVED
ncbi:MAG: hypothetical protein QG574_4763 [Cyanobacteriota bacterium erpe_2018_sw_21hr_WHONDRS-SW48-000092_B_bin.40]|nr:hypothetical protein [Cyanobacteriota bacterium erpe_2018_sw_21hr_WHONDRS-SW48-000092_B_bin.40]